jgi:hypothetical protein
VRVIQAAAVSAVATALLTGCFSSSGCSDAGAALGASPAAASCAAGVEYDGTFYQEWSRKLPVAKGRALGSAIYPACHDTGGCVADDDAQARPTQVWAMRGVDPDQMIVGREEGSGRLVVMGGRGVDPKRYFHLTDGTWHFQIPRHGR